MGRALFLFLFLSGIQSGQMRAEDGIEAFERRLNVLRQNPLYRQLFEPQKGGGLSKPQKELIDLAIERMSPAEIDENLKKLSLPVSGSDYQKRFRLRQAMGTIPPPSLPSQQGVAKIEIENAGEGEFMKGSDDRQGLLILRGKIRVKTHDGYFTASTVIMDTNRKEIYGEGDLVYHSKSGIIRAERIIIDQRLGTGILYNASGYQKPVYFIGPAVTRTSDMKYALSHAYFTTCAARTPHYNFTARKIWIHENERIIAVGVLFYVGGVPLLPLPFLYATDWGTGIITRIGYGKIQGAYMQNTYQFSVPGAYTSSFLPVSYRIKADTYARTGSMGGVEFMRFSPNLNYFFDLGKAHYTRYELVSDYRNREQFSVTNRVPIPMRYNGTQLYDANGKPIVTYGVDSYEWYKGFGILNANSANGSKNSVRNISARFEDYSHPLYEYEFGGRSLPESTIPALYTNAETAHGLLRRTTNWNFVWNETHDDLNLRVEASRNRVWYDYPNDPEMERYVPANEVAPSVDIKKTALLGTLPYFNAPVFWDTQLHTDVRRNYILYTPNSTDRSLEKTVYTFNNSSAQSGFRMMFSFFPYLTLSPSLGYGIQRTIPEASFPALSSNPTLRAIQEQQQQNQRDVLDRQAKRTSYEFAYSDTELTLGPDVLFLRADHRTKDTNREELKSTSPFYVEDVAGQTIGFDEHQKINETELAVEFNPASFASFSVSSVYDHRKFEYAIRNRDRWSYTVFRSEIFLDFVNLFRPERENLLSRKKLHFLGLRLSNDLIYDSVHTRNHSDVFGTTFQAGGFDLLLLRRLRYFESGFYWYHVYHDPSLDHMRYFSKADVQLTKYLYFEMELESRATQVEKYFKSTRQKNLPPLDPNNLEQSYINRYLVENYDADYRKAYVPFTEDLYYGSGAAGAKKQQEAVFNVGYFDAALIIDLHDWELKIGYSLEQRTVFGGLNMFDAVHYYDNRVYLGMTLLRFGVAGTGHRQSRFILNRRRVRSADIGRTSIGMERLY